MVRSTHPGTGATNAEGRGSQKVIVYTRLVAHVSTHHVKKKSGFQREAAVHPGRVPKLGILTLVTSHLFPVCCASSQIQYFPWSLLL